MVRVLVAGCILTTEAPSPSTRKWPVTPGLEVAYVNIQLHAGGIHGG